MGTNFEYRWGYFCVLAYLLKVNIGVTQHIAPNTYSLFPCPLYCPHKIILSYYAILVIDMGSLSDP